MAQLRLERSGSPTGIKRFLFRAPLVFYRAGLGFLLGKRFLMLEHTGRKTGQMRRTVLEVLANHPGAVYVAAGWGSRAQWLKNIEADPHVAFHLGSNRFETVAEVVAYDDALEVVSEYEAAHPRAIDRLAAFMLEDPGETGSERVKRIAESVPVVRLPRGS